MLKGDSQLNVTVGEVEVDGDWQIRLNVTVLPCTRKSCQRKRQDKAQALATMLQPYAQMASQQGAKMVSGLDCGPCFLLEYCRPL